MKLYCFGQSGHSYKVANYLNLAGISFEPIYVDFFNQETWGEDYRHNVNAMGEAPVLIDNDVKLAQSGVILEYLVDKTGAFKPDDRYENLRWVLWDNHKLSSQIGLLRFLKNFLPEEKRPAEAIAFLQGRTKAALKVLNGALEDRAFLLGDDITPADFSCSSYLFYPEDFGFVRAGYPHIDAWLTRIENMDNWKHPYDLMPTDQNVLNSTPSAHAWHKEG